MSETSRSEYDETASRLGPLEALASRLKAAGLQSRIFVSDEGQPGAVKNIEILVPNGRGTRPVVVFEGQADSISEVPFENIKFLGDYQAVHFQKSTENVIEAGLKSASPAGSALSGLAQITRRSPARGVGGSGSDLGRRGRRFRDRIRATEPLVVSDGEFTIEISPPSMNYLHGPNLLLYYQPDYTLKLFGESIPPTHDDALGFFENLACSYLLDLDIRYGVSFELSRVEGERPYRHLEPTQEPPEFPRNRYHLQAMALYRYGRSASRFPLLEFLAYYQVVEFFFPVFTHERSIRMLRQAINHPKFDSKDDAALAKLVGLLHPSGRNALSEREQLRATILACIDSTTIEEFILGLGERKDHFCNKKQDLPGLNRIVLGSDQRDVREQLAERIYDIRCRIVHTKQNSADSGVDLLLPSSPEARSLWHEIELLRLLAQHVLIACASR